MFQLRLIDILRVSILFGLEKYFLCGYSSYIVAGSEATHPTEQPKLALTYAILHYPINAGWQL